MLIEQPAQRSDVSESYIRQEPSVFVEVMKSIGDVPFSQQNQNMPVVVSRGAGMRAARFGSFVRRSIDDVLDPIEIGVYGCGRVAKCVETGWVLFPADGVVWCGRGRLRLRGEERMLIFSRAAPWIGTVQQGRVDFAKKSISFGSAGSSPAGVVLFALSSLPEHSFLIVVCIGKRMRGMDWRCATARRQCILERTLDNNSKRGAYCQVRPQRDQHAKRFMSFMLDARIYFQRHVFIYSPLMLVHEATRLNVLNDDWARLTRASDCHTEHIYLSPQ
ncbi:hypothetical protein KCU93_g79, partial [Aureobasidium melanogenum]